MDSIDDNGAELEMKHKAYTIAKRLKEIRKLCADSEQQKSIDMAEIDIFMSFIANQLTEKDGDLFERSFIGLLEVISELANNSSSDFCNFFTETTEMMCELCQATELRQIFVERWFCVWRHCIENLPSASKDTVYRQLNCSEAFKGCVMFVTKADSISSQFMMSYIVRSYLQSARNPLETLCRIFAGVPGGDKFKRFTEIGSQSDSDISIPMIFQLLKCINQAKTDPIFTAESVESMKFDDSVILTIPDKERCLYFNNVAKTIEFWILHDSSPTLVQIRSKNVKHVELIRLDLYCIRNMKLILKSAPRFSCGGQKISNLPTTVIDVTFDVGIHQSVLEAMIFEMFAIKPEIVNEEVEYESGDSDIEIIEEEISMRRSMQSTRALADASIDLVVPETRKTESYNIKPLATLDVKPPMIELSDNEQHNIRTPQKTVTAPSTSQFQIPTTSFYNHEKPKEKSAKRTKVEKPKKAVEQKPKLERKRRAAAATANQNIKKSLQDDSIYDFEIENVDDDAEPDVTPPKKRRNADKPTKKQAPKTKHFEVPVFVVPERNAVKRQPQKLWNMHQDDSTNVSMDMDMPQKKEPQPVKCISSVELTPLSFKSSQYKDPQRQLKRTLENAQKVNERVQKDKEPLHLNVTHSYRAHLKDTSKCSVSDSVGDATNQLEHFTGDFEEENIDVNKNNNQCPCIRANQLVERDLKRISGTANRALLRMDVNKQKCACCRNTVSSPVHPNQTSAKTMP